MSSTPSKTTKPSQRDWLEYLAGLLIIVTLALMIRGKVACSAEGGTYLRGFLWFECVHVPK